MTFQFREAKRENVPLLLGVAGGTGAGKTWSAMALAKGMAGGKRFAVIDTENGRAKHYADDFAFDTADLTAPFRPERYADAIQAADAAGYGVIIVDSMSHEWAGDGGILDWQEEEFARLGSREAVRMTSWIVPKMSHRKMVTRLLQVNAHVILCFRAAERVDMVKDAQGKTQVVPKQSLTGLDGWIPIAERTLPFELTASFLMTADKPGHPKAIKLPRQFEPFFPLDRPVTEETGRALAEWAAGGQARTPEGKEPDAPLALTEAQVKRLDMLVGQLRDGGHITTEQLYKATSRPPTASEDGELHWSPLRDSLTKVEGIQLIDRLAKLEETVGKQKFEIPEAAKS